MSEELFTIDDDGITILMGGEAVATIDNTVEGGARMKKGQSAYKEAVILWLSEKPELVEAAANIEGNPEPEAGGEDQAGAPPEIDPQVTQAAPEQEQPKEPEASFDLGKGESVTVTGKIPPAPPMTLRDGDKTPEYVSWVSNYHPEEFNERYSGRKHPRPVSLAEQQERLEEQQGLDRQKALTATEIRERSAEVLGQIHGAE